MAGVLLFIAGFRKNKQITEDEASNGNIWNQIMVGLVTIIAIVNVGESGISIKVSI
jgi:hypothetical protein